MPPHSCSATTVKGKPCKRGPVDGTDPALCPVHLGAAVKPTGLTDEIANRLVELLRAGNYVETACIAGGVPKATFYDWLKRGADQPDSDFGKFRARIENARAEGEARNVALVARAAASDWKAAAWMLERQYPDRWGRPAVRPIEDRPPAGTPDLPDRTNLFDELDKDELAERRRARGA